MTTFLSSYDVSPYADLRKEYTRRDASIGFVGSTVLPKPIHITQDSVGGNDNEITSTLAFVCDAVSAGELVLSDNGKDNLLIFTDVKRNQSNSCAFRMSTVNCPGIPGKSFRFTVFFDMTADRQCQVPFHPLEQSRGLSSLANLAARSLMETQTDPDFVGYEDAWGNNLDDLCAWSFQVPYVTFPDGSHWKLQDLWSNEAYRDGTGHPNQDGKKGCVNAR